MQDRVPAKVNLLQGRPTRVQGAGGRYRFGITGVSEADARVRFTVLHEGVNEPFSVRQGDRIEAAGCRWSVAEVEVREPGGTFVQLVRETEGAA
ncbi:MAG: DUF6406 domain-containing protein [Nocardioidaceae bacterium]